MSLEAFLQRILFAVVALMALILFAATRREALPEGELILAMSQEPDSMDPIFGEMVASSVVRGALLRELVIYDDQWRRVADLAAEVPTLENGGIKLSPDGKKMTTTFKIRADATWSDGVPVTAADFQFCHQVVMDPDQPVISRDTNERVEGLDAPDPKTLVIRWKELYAYSNDYRVLRAVPSHILRPIYEKDPKTYHQNPLVNRLPVGNGPFVLTEWIPGDRLILNANPMWKRGGPKLKRVTYRIIPNTNGQIVNLLSKTVGGLSVLSISLDQALDLERRWGHRQKATISPGLTWEHIDLKLEEPLLADSRVRHAILHAIDREQMGRRLFEGRQKVADSYLPERHYAYKSVLAGVKFDPARSRALLEEAGFKLGADGTRVSPQGERLSLSFHTTAGNQLREQVQQIIKGQLAAVGIEVVIKNYPGKVFFSEFVKKRKYGHMAMFAWTMSPISDGLTQLTSKMIASEKNSWQGQNVSGFRNARVDELLEKCQTTVSDIERAKLLIEVQEIFGRELPSIPLFFRAEVSAVNAGLKGWRPTGHLVPETWNAEEWSFGLVGPGAGAVEAQ